jgi:hypothetical protein
MRTAWNANNAAMKRTSGREERRTRAKDLQYIYRKNGNGLEPAQGNAVDSWVLETEGTHNEIG